MVGTRTTGPPAFLRKDRAETTVLAIFTIALRKKENQGAAVAAGLAAGAGVAAAESIAGVADGASTAGAGLATAAGVADGEASAFATGADPSSSF